MKRLAALIGVALAATITHAAPLLQLDLPTNEVQQVTLAMSPSYAPGLTLANGEKAEWGMAAGLFYPVATPMTLVGVKGEWLADQFWGANVNLTLQLPVKVLGKSVTPFVVGGAMFPIEDIMNENANVSALAGAGIYFTIWQSDNEKLSVQCFFEYEHWFQLNADVYHAGPCLTLKF